MSDSLICITFKSQSLPYNNINNTHVLFLHSVYLYCTLYTSTYSNSLHVYVLHINLLLYIIIYF